MKNLNDYIVKYRKLLTMDDVRISADMTIDRTLTIEQLSADVIKIIKDKYKS